MKKLFTIGILCIAALPAWAGNGEPDFEAVEIETVKVADNVYMLSGYGGNIGLVVDESQTLMIDSQFRELSGKVKAAIQAITDKPVAHLVNTHFHFDHTDGNPHYMPEVKTVIAHDNARKRLSEGSEIKFLEKKVEPVESANLPTLTFGDKLHIHQAGEEVELLHFAKAHTDTDVVVFLKNANVIHTGDLYFRGMYPFIDIENGGDMYGYLKAQEALLKRMNAQTKIIPGHGPLASRRDFEGDLVMFRSMGKLVERSIVRGLSLDEIKALPEAKRYEETHGQGFLSTDKFIDLLYGALK